MDSVVNITSYHLTEAEKGFLLHSKEKLFFAFIVVAIDAISYTINYYGNGVTTTNIYIALPLAIFFILLAFLKPLNAFSLMLLLIANTHYLRVFSVKLPEVLAITLFFSLLIRGKLTRLNKLTSIHWFLLFIIAAFFSLLFKPDTLLEGSISPWLYGTIQIGRLLLVCCTIWVTFSIIRKLRYFYYALHALLIGFAIHSFFALLQIIVFWISKEQISLGRVAIEIGFFRLTGMTSDPGAITLYLNIAIFTCLYAKEIIPKHRRLMLFLNTTLIMCSIAQVLTFSAVGYLSCVLGLIIYYFHSKKKFIFIITVSLIIFLILFLSSTKILALIDLFSDKIRVDILSTLFSYGSRYSPYSIRAAYDISYLKMFKDYPVKGVGYGQSGYYLGNYLHELGLEESLIKGMYIDETTHGLNNYFIFLAETGIIGIIFFLLFLSFTFYVLTFRLIPKQLNPARRGMLSIFITIILSLYSSNAFFAPYFLVHIAMILALIPLSKEIYSKTVF